MNVSEFRAVLPKICDQQTSQDAEGWKPDNPLWGHCAVVSTLAQDLFGGTLERVSLEGTPFAAARSHYFNRLPDGTLQDFTVEQFGGWDPSALVSQERPRDYVLSYGPTAERYERLKGRLETLQKSS